MENITAVRISEMYETGKNGDVLAKYPHNKGSGIILEKGCKVEAEMDGKWETLWEVRISNNLKFGPKNVIQLNKGHTMSELIELIKKYKKFLKVAVTDDFKNLYRGKIEGLILAFDSIALQGEITSETVDLCNIKEEILKEE